MQHLGARKFAPIVFWGAPSHPLRRLMHVGGGALAHTPPTFIVCLHPNSFLFNGNVKSSNSKHARRPTKNVEGCGGGGKPLHAKAGGGGGTPQNTIGANYLAHKALLALNDLSVYVSQAHSFIDKVWEPSAAQGHRWLPNYLNYYL